MEFLQPSKWREALEARAAHPDALPIWGGTDVMVEMNFARKRPEALLDLTRIEALSRWEGHDGWLRIGAGVTYTRAIDELGDRLPGLAMASRTVVRDVGRALDIPLSEIDRITKKIAAGPNAPTLAKALESDAELIAIRDELPQTATGKILRREIRAELSEA